MNKTTFLEELQQRMESTSIESCKDIDSPEVKPGDTVLGEMSPLARRLYQVTEQYQREQKKIRGTYLRVKASSLEADREKEAKEELASLQHAQSILDMKIEAVNKIMWIELNSQFHDHVTDDALSLGICKGNVIIMSKSAGMPFPFKFLFGGGERT